MKRTIWFVIGLAIVLSPSSLFSQIPPYGGAAEFHSGMFSYMRASAGAWSIAAALLSAFGIIHAYDLTAGGITSRFGLMAAPEFFTAYLMLALLFFAIGWIAKKDSLQ